jgi:hypothetical protein
LMKSSVQIGQEKFGCSFGDSVSVAGVVVPRRSESFSALVVSVSSFRWPPVTDGGDPSAAGASRRSMTPSSSVPRDISTSPLTGSVLGSELSPNLTMGIVSSIALAIPRARLCRGRPAVYRGP